MATTTQERIRRTPLGGIFMAAVREALKERAGASEALVEMMVRGKVRHVREALGSDYFDELLLDAMHKRMTMGHKSWTPAWPFIARKETISDFREQNRIAVSEFADMPQLTQLEPYKLASLGDYRAKYQVFRYGHMFAISLEAQTNDELGLFGRLGEKFGVASARTIDRFVVSTKLDANPVLSIDSVALFDTTHNNISGSTGRPTIANLRTAIAKMLAQVGWDQGEGTTPEVLFMPKQILVGPTDLVEARENVRSATVDNGGSTTPRGSDNAIKSFLSEPIPTPFLTGATPNWYILADPAVNDLFELGFLDGKSEPTVSREAPNSGWEFEHDAMRTRARVIFGGEWLDWRGIVKVPGA